MRRYYDEIINGPNYDQLDRIFSVKIVWHNSLLPGGEVRGLERFKEALRMVRSAFPDLHITVEDRLSKETR